MTASSEPLRNLKPEDVLAGMTLDELYSEFERRGFSREEVDRLVAERAESGT